MHGSREDSSDNRFPCSRNCQSTSKFSWHGYLLIALHPNVASITQPLRRLLQEGVKYECTDECNQSFQQLKTLIKQAKCLAHPDFTRPFRLQTDASNCGIVAVLLQQVEDSSWQPITFISRALTCIETNYSTTEKELLAIVWAFNKLHPYLHGTEVTVETDHQPLVALINKSHPPGRLLR